MGEVAGRLWELPLTINGFSLIILFVFYLDNHSKHHDIKSQKYFFFQYMVIANMLLLILDGITWAMLGRPGTILRIVNTVATTMYYTLTPLPSFFFISFADEVLSVPAERRRRLARWYVVPVALNWVMSLASPFTGWFFQIDSLNAYRRGSLLLVSFVLSFALMFTAFVKVLLRYLAARKENNEIAKNVKEYGWLLKFTFIPLLGGVLQGLMNNVTYVWNVTVIALLILYVNYQNGEITTDPLTGLYNRRQAYAYFDRFVRERVKTHSSIAVIMMDINNFKSINDTYGHSMGDQAIVSVARCLETEFEWDDFICRFGGDEFLVITKHGTAANLKAVLQRVNDCLAALHGQENNPFELSLSAGYAQYARKSNTLDLLFKKADEMMFEQKAKMMRRASDRRD